MIIFFCLAVGLQEQKKIEKYGKRISMRSITHKLKKVYDRNRLKKAGIKYYDDLPLLCFDA